MAQTLKLEIFKIAIKPRNSREDFVDFNNLFESIDEDKDQAYQKFFSDFIDLFGGKFKSDQKKTKGICTTNQNKGTIRSINNIIDIEMWGGTIGSLQLIFNQDNADEEIGKIGLNEIASLPFYIKLWTPFDHSSGILMVQSYTDHTVSNLVKIIFREFIKSYGFTLNFSPFTPEAIKEEYLKNSHVYEIKMITDKVSRGKRALINPLFADEQDLKITVTVSGFKHDVNDFWRNIKGYGANKVIGANLDDLDMSEEAGYNIKAYYKDENGHLANVGIKNIYDISPTIFLPEEIMSGDTRHFDYEKIKRHTDRILEQIKIEIGYN